MKFRFFLFSSLFPAILLATSSMANVSANGSVSINHNDNLPNATGANNVFGDSYGEVTFSLGKLFNPAVGKSVLLTADMESRTYQHTNGLNRLALGGTVAYTQRLGLGAYAPRLKLSVGAKQYNYRQNLRDSWIVKVGFGVEKRFTPAFRMEAGFQYEDRKADEGNAAEYSPVWSKRVFFQQNRELNGLAEYTFENYSSLSLRYRYRDGEADTSVHPGSSLAAFSKAIIFDPAMGSDYIAYLLNSTSHTYAVDWSYPIGNDIAVGISYEQRRAKVDGGNRYRSNILSAQFTIRF